MLQTLKHLSSLSLTYGFGSLLVRLSGLLLIPIYTRNLTTSDYGILSVATAAATLVAGVLGLGLADAAIRFYFDATSHVVRRRIFGTVWTTWSIVATTVGLLLLVAGPAISGWTMSDIPFFPYLFLALVIAYFQAAQGIPSALIRAQERARLFVMTNLGIFLISAVLSIVLIVIYNQGAAGALIARAAAHFIGAVFLTFILLRQIRVSIQRNVAESALRFGLPLVLTVFFGWLLRLSDRVLMQRFVSLGEIGVYTLGYQLGETILMIGFAINSAWSPFYFATFQEHGNEAPGILSPIVTYWMLILVAAALALSVLAEEVVLLVSTPAYADAAAVVPWIAAATVVQVFNVIQRFSFMNAKVTAWDPVIFLLGGATNVALNLVLIPRYGAIAAAWNTLIAMVVMGVAMFVISQRISRFDYEYKRLVLLAAAALVIFAASLAVPELSTLYSVAIKVGLLGLYPVVLVGLGFLSRRERVAIRAVYTRYLND